MDIDLKYYSGDLYSNKGKEEVRKKVKEINEAIRNLEQREKHSKNPMEKRQLRSQIGYLQRQLKIYD